MLKKMMNYECLIMIRTCMGQTTKLWSFNGECFTFSVSSFIIRHLFFDPLPFFMIGRVSFVVSVAMFAGLLVACRPSPPRQDDTTKAHDARAPSYATLSPGEVGVKAYRGEGRVVRIEPDGKHVTIAHQAIPGFMSAMTMT